MLASAASDVGTSDATFPLVIVAFAVVGVVLIVAVVLTSKVRRRSFRRGTPAWPYDSPAPLTQTLSFSFAMQLPAMTRAHEKHVDFVHLMTSKTRELAGRRPSPLKSRHGGKEK